MSSVAESHLKLLKEKALRDTHRILIDEIAELSSAIDVAASAVEAGRDSTRLDTGMMPEQFDAAAKPIETYQAVAWLRRSGAETRVVDLERQVEREATPTNWRPASRQQRSRSLWPSATPHNVFTVSLTADVPGSGSHQENR